MTALFDLIDGEVVVADDKPPPAPYEPPKPRTSHVNRNVLMLEEHLVFAVPLRMRELEHLMHNHPVVRSGEYTWQKALLVWFYHGRQPKQAYGKDTAANTDPVQQVATQGDLLLSVEGQHKNAGKIAAALVDGLATGALLNTAGITYRGMHWCRDHCPKKPKLPPPAEWKQQFDEILNDLKETNQ